MAENLKRLLTIQDLSCFGKSSMTVALPVISAAGIEAVPLPTALLSTHTTGFTGYCSYPLTEQMRVITAHWQACKIRFDGIYTGYLASAAQIDLVCTIVDSFAHTGIHILVDPVMGDGGTLYDGFSPEYPRQFQKLCQKAEWITPNVTEACLLCNKPYVGNSNANHALLPILTELEQMTGGKKVVITGVTDASGTQIGVLGSDHGKIFSLMRPYHPAPVCGSGDLFASALAALLLCGIPFEQAVSDSECFVEQAILSTMPVLQQHPYGLRFEPCLSLLYQFATRSR